MGRHSAVTTGGRKKGCTLPDTMQRAIDLHVLHKKSIRTAAKETGVPYPTLQRYVTNFKMGKLSRLVPNYDVNKVFTHEQELSLHDYIIECAEKFYGLTTKACRRIAYQMAKLNNIKMPKSWEDNEMAGKDWLRGFKKRFPDLRVKKPEACSIARATAFNKTNIESFFKNLKNALKRHASFGNGTRIYNLDETSTTTVQRPQKVVAAKGRSVCKITSGERGVLVTTCCIVNSLGQALPPVMIFPRKKFQPHMLHGAPPGTLGLANPSGWMNASLFTEVMRHFITHTSASKSNPALLIMDNHESHLSIEALDLAKDNGVTVLTLHPHTTDRMQPLDVGLLAPFKRYYNAAVDSFLMRNPGKSMTIYNVAECVGVAYLKSMTPVNIINAFRKCGIFPFDDQIFDEIDFLPSSVTDRPFADEAVDRNDNAVDSEIPCKSSSIRIVAQTDDETDAEEVSCDSPSLLNDLELNQKLTMNPPLLQTLAFQTVLPALTSTMKTPNTEVENATVTAKIQHSNINTGHDVPGPSKFITPQEFRPALKAQPRKKRHQRKRGKSMIATDTPEKEALKAKKIKVTKAAKTKPRKNIKKVKHDLFNDRKNISKKTSAVASSSSDDEYEKFKASGSSSGGQEFISESEDEEFCMTDNFPPLEREPKEKDYVLIRFTSKNDVYYVAEILEKLEDDDECDFFVSYLKLKSKMQQKFTLSLIPDTAGVRREDVKYILPPPTEIGTSRRTSTFKFPINMSLINLRY